ncbi:RICIN domain-containing protein [Streptomyces xiangluensis]|uniref:RICIN domain-containing protein n=1 Tax=Streptomyces xiangluensis TaxID=2665720 RepID=A0ABV8Z935_9ACTN
MSDHHRTVGEAAAASPDAASVEAHLTGRKPSSDPLTASTPASASGSAPARTPGAIGRQAAVGEEETNTGAEEEPTARKPASRGGPAAGPTSEPEADVSGEGAIAPQTSETSVSRGETGTGAAAGGEGASGRRAGGIWGRASRRDRHTAAAASPDGNADGVGATATAAVAVRGDSPDGDEDVPGRPNKPLLAGVAMAGAILIAVPLLVMAVGDDDDDKSQKVAPAADTVLDDDGAKSGVFVAESPTSKKPEEKADKGQSPRAKKPANPSEKQVLPSPSAAATPEAKKRKAATASGSSALPTVLTRVLIKNNTNGTCVDVPGFSNGSTDGPVIHAQCNNTTDDNQLWNVEKKYGSAGPGGVPLFQIRNVTDSLCLDLGQFGARPGATKVQEFPCNGTTADNQLWWLDKQADGTYWIRNFASRNQCLDSYANNDQNRQLIIWPCAPENNHEWSFTRK